MGRSLTNNTAMSYAIEASLGVLPGSPVWHQLEPNSVGDYGADITTVARDPISRNRQRRKGTTTDLDSKVSFEADLTLSHFTDFVEGFVFSVAVNQDISFVGSDTTGTGYTVASLITAQVDKLLYTSGGPISLLYGRGYVDPANNGLKELNSKPIATDTELTVSALVAETAPTNATFDIGGIRPEVGDLAIVVTGTGAVLTSDNNAVSNPIDFTELGLTVGQFIHVGGLLTANQFSAGFGYARVMVIAAQQLTLDKLGAGLATDAGAAETVDLLFGRFIRNVPTDSAEFLERSFNFELAFDNLETPGPGDMYEYAAGNYSNTMAITLPLAEKSTVAFDFIGTDALPPTTSRATNAATALAPGRTGAFNTTTDCVNLRIAEFDETAEYVDFKNVVVTFNNNVSPEKVLCNLGARFMNYGNFDMTLEAQLIFSDSGITEAIRNNVTMTMDFGLKNDDGAMYIDVPAMTVGGGGRDFPVNESILINTTINAFQHPTLGTSIGVSLFPVVP